MHENRSKEAAESRRGFTYLMGAGTGIVAAASAKNLLNEFLDTMSTSADVKAMAQLEVELGNITEGQNLVLKWQGKPTFVRRRTVWRLYICLVPLTLSFGNGPFFRQGVRFFSFFHPM